MIPGITAHIIGVLYDKLVIIDVIEGSEIDINAYVNSSHRIVNLREAVFTANGTGLLYVTNGEPTQIKYLSVSTPFDLTSIPVGSSPAIYDLSSIYDVTNIMSICQIGTSDDSYAQAGFIATTTSNGICIGKHGVLNPSPPSGRSMALLNITGGFWTPESLSFSKDGLKLYAYETYGGNTFEYNLTERWDESTAYIHDTYAHNNAHQYMIVDPSGNYRWAVEGNNLYVNELIDRYEVSDASLLSSDQYALVNTAIDNGSLMAYDGIWLSWYTDALDTLFYVNQLVFEGAAPTTINITELDGSTAYYSFASALTADRIVMDVFPLSGNAGLPTGVPSVTDEVFQTLDFTLTAGSIQEIGRNGSTYFDGWIKNVKVYSGATLIADCALDEVMSSGTATDVSGNGNNLTANNFAAANTLAYTDDGVGFAGPEMIDDTVLASPYLAQGEWAFDSGTSQWTLTGSGARSLLEFYASADQPTYFRIEANVVSINSEYLNFVINATGGEYVDTTGTHVFYCVKSAVTRQSFHRRVGSTVVNATLSDISLKSYLSYTTPL